MRKLKVDSSKCIACGQCELVCSKAFFKVEDREKSAIRISQENGENKITVCVQCGKCIDVCPVNAIAIDKNGVVKIDKNKCVGCLSCVGFCDYLAMYYHHEEVIPFKCVACGLCAKACPTEALILEK